MRNTIGLVGRPNTWNREGHIHFWGVPGRTLPAIIEGLRNGGPRLAMPESLPPSPTPLLRLQPRKTTSSSSTHFSPSGPARSVSSSHRASPTPCRSAGSSTARCELDDRTGTPKSRGGPIPQHVAHTGVLFLAVFGLDLGPHASPATTARCTVLENPISRSLKPRPQVRT
jgi:hypothetical protein